MTGQAVFFDRDGVLTKPVVTASGSLRPPWSLEELSLEPGAVEVVSALRGQGWRCFVVTNQPDAAAGRVSVAVLDLIHDTLRAAMPIDDIAVCLHPTSAGCGCKKPAPGMLRSLAVRWDVDLSRSWTVGDRWVDIEAGRRAGTRTILVEGPQSWMATSAGGAPCDLRPDATVSAVGQVLGVIGVRSSR